MLWGDIMRVIIAGSRTLTDIRVVEWLMCALGANPQCPPEIVSGTARGVDQLGEQWAQANGAKVTRFPADWDRYGKSAGYKRNAQMAGYADKLVAIWDGESRGTKHMIDLMTQAGKPVFVHLLST